MAKNSTQPNMARIINMADGPRDYPLKSGASIYLEPKGKHATPVYITPEDISDALLTAEKKGLIRIERVTGKPENETEEVRA